MTTQRFVRSAAKCLVTATCLPANVAVLPCAVMLESVPTDIVYGALSIGTTTPGGVVCQSDSGAVQKVEPQKSALTAGPVRMFVPSNVNAVIRAPRVPSTTNVVLPNSRTYR